MKNKYLLISLCLIFAIGIFSFWLNSFRFNISEPMLDVEYKKEIIKASKNPFYKLENMRAIAGEKEFIQFVKENNNNSQIYTPSEENIQKGIYRANLHTHTLQSDGRVSVKHRLDSAQEHAEKHFKDGYMYIGITDHNTVLGAKDAVDVVQKNPDKYKNIKIVLGMETYTSFNSKYSKSPVDIHVLNWCINPFDQFLNREFYKRDDANKWNRWFPDRTFEFAISYMSDYSIPAIAHPIRHGLSEDKYKKVYFDEMLTKYKKLSKKPLIVEGYYQVYPRYFSDEYYKTRVIEYIDYINKKADELGILKTGGTDAHGASIF